MKIMRWREIGGDGACRASASHLCGRVAFPLHRHDFSEVFWITGGSGTHRINGEKHALRAGVLVFVRPDDTHSFHSDANGVLVENLVIRPRILDDIRRRYFLKNDTVCWGSAARVPEHYEVSSSQLQQLHAGFHQLSFRPKDVFQTERFLLNLLHLVHFEAVPVDTGQRSAGSELPGWLAKALAVWPAGREHFVEGTAGLARLAGRSPEHVARVMRACTGRTPSDCLNTARMTYAARQLEVTDRKILDIAMDCGFDSLGHFYSVFQREHGCPPRVYRMKFQPRPI